ncbi:AIPR family protein [Planctomycetota bacterium]|nr:AIPR family protein [Planctomycetota bacterium]
MEDWANIFWNRALMQYRSGDPEEEEEILSKREVVSRMIGDILVEANYLPGLHEIYLERNGGAKAHCIIDGYYFDENPIEEDEDEPSYTLHLLNILNYKSKEPDLENDQPSLDEILEMQNELTGFVKNLFDNSFDCEKSEYRLMDFKRILSDLKGQVASCIVHTYFYGGSGGKTLLKSLPEYNEESGFKVHFKLSDFSSLSLLEDFDEGDEGVDISLEKADRTEKLNSIAISTVSNESGAKVCKVFLSAIPGDVLADAYEKNGKRLMKSNVRAFLQMTKINKGIKKTATDEPQKFFVYNNGISATAKRVRGDSTEGSQFDILGFDGFQVVNGGQTVASLHRAKYFEDKDISDVWVQAKITEVASELPEDESSRLVANIARYSNSQTAVKDSDFSSNAPVHLRLAKLSRQVKSTRGDFYWYYERARGLYETERSRDPQAFDKTYPKANKINKIQLAQYHFAFETRPCALNEGGEKYFKIYMKEEWPDEESSDSALKAEEHLDEQFYKDLVAKGLVYKAAMEMAGPKNLNLTKNGGYKSQAEAFTIALFWRRYRNVEGLLAEIWEEQDAGEEIRKVFKDWLPKVMGLLTESARKQGRNVTEWAKREGCWTDIKDEGDNFESPSLELRKRQAARFMVKEDKFDAEHETLLTKMSVLWEQEGANGFQRIVEWGKENIGSEIRSPNLAMPSNKRQDGFKIESKHWKITSTCIDWLVKVDVDNRWPSIAMARWFSELQDTYNDFETD